MRWMKWPLIHNKAVDTCNWWPSENYWHVHHDQSAHDDDCNPCLTSSQVKSRHRTHSLRPRQHIRSRRSVCCLMPNDDDDNNFDDDRLFKRRINFALLSKCCWAVASRWKIRRRLERCIQWGDGQTTWYRINIVSAAAAATQQTTLDAMFARWTKERKNARTDAHRRVGGR